MAKQKSTADIAASNARALLAQFTGVGGKVNHAAFLAEMDARAAASGTKLTSDQYGLLGRIVAAYENEVRS